MSAGKTKPKFKKLDTRFLGTLGFHGVILFRVGISRKLATGTWVRTVRLELDTGHSVQFDLFASGTEDDIRIRKVDY